MTDLWDFAEPNPSVFSTSVGWTRIKISKADQREFSNQSVSFYTRSHTHTLSFPIGSPALHPQTDFCRGILS